MEKAKKPIQKNKPSIKDALDYSVLVIVTKQNATIYGSGFILEKEENKEKKYFLITSYALTDEAGSIHFITYNSSGNKSFEVEDRQPKKSPILDSAIFDVSKVANKDGGIWPSNILKKDCFLSYKNNCDVLETLFVISRIQEYPPIVMECKNISAVRKERNTLEKEFFVLNSKKYDWNLGSPVFGIFNKKIKLVGMIVKDEYLPDDICPFVGSCEIEWLSNQEKII